jgi:predicted transcriptional regulator of viral defense system
MGKIKYSDKIQEFIQKTPALRARDVEIIIKNKRYAHIFLHNLRKKGGIKRITKGWYSMSDDPVVSVFCFKPSYIGLQDALSIHNLWEQETNTVIVTTRKVRVGARKIMDNNVILHRIAGKYFFGFDYMKYDNFFIPVSDVEKTLIDLVYFNEIPDKKVLQEIRKKMDGTRLKKYLSRYPPKFKGKIAKLVDLKWKGS